MDRLPETIQNEEQLDEVMTRPNPALVESIRSVSSPLVILGAGGKMGFSLAVLARRAAEQADHPLDILAVSRFSDPSVRERFEAQGIRTTRQDLMDPAAFERLPDAADVLYLVGLKFGTHASPALTWATNTLVPAYAAARYAHARMATLSTGNVYPLVPVGSGGSKESDPLTPLGEYANACVARERIFQYFSEKNRTPMIMLRLSYALDLRYGVLVDIANRVWNGTAVDVRMGWVNCIWQGDANSLILRSLALADVPPLALNLVGGQHLSVQQIALRLGKLMEREVTFTGQESPTALLSDNAMLVSALGEPTTPIQVVIKWVADWVMAGGRQLNKPTHFEVRDGAY